MALWENVLMLSSSFPTTFSEKICFRERERERQRTKFVFTTEETLKSLEFRMTKEEKSSVLKAVKMTA